jgi:glycosyltransferase involved in cell wall biosynthesis
VRAAVRVLHVTPYFAPAFRYGGPPRSVLGLCRALGRAGIEIEVLTTTADGPADLPVSPSGGDTFEGVAVRYLERSFPQRLFGARGLGAALDVAIARSDVVHVHGLWTVPAWAAARRARRAGVPLVISPRGMLDPGSMAQRAWRKRIAYRLLERRSLLDAAFLHATSDSEARALRAWAPGAPVVMLPNGVEPPATPSMAPGALRRRLGVPAGAPIVTFLGRIHPIKRLDLLAQAFERVLAREPRARLVIAGPDERGHRRTLEPRFAAMASAVTWAGELGDEEKWALLADSTLLVQCSDSESFGLSAAEAMAAGLPVVATRTCPWEEIETAGAGFWVTQDPEAIAGAMLTVLADPARAHAMGEHGRALVHRRYSWETVASEMAQWYGAVSRRAPTVIVTPGFAGVDGLSAMSRLVARALLPARVLALNDTPAAAEPGQGIGLATAGGSKLRFAALAARMLRRGPSPADVLCLHMRLAPLARLLAWWRGARLTTVLVGIECWRRLRRLERAAFERSHTVLAISQHTVTRFGEANPGLVRRDIVVCHLAVPSLGVVDAPAPPPASGFALPVSGFALPVSGFALPVSGFALPVSGFALPVSGFALIVGRLAGSERYKGHDLLFELWPRLLIQCPDAVLVVAGDGDDRARLEAKAARVRSAVRFEGRVGDERLEALYRDCGFFVMPSTGEGFGLVFLEAMRAGRACIAAAGAADELIEDGVSGYVVDPDDSEAVLKALVRLFQDPELAWQMGKAGRARWEREFTEEAFKSRLLACLGRSSR